jgi:hypothetical protein
VPLFLGFIAGPSAWLTALEAAYVASYVACDPAKSLHLHLAALSPLLLIAIGTAVLVRARASQDGAHLHSWAAVMSTAGLWMCAAFTLLTLVMYLPVLGLAPCV